MPEGGPLIDRRARGDDRRRTQDRAAARADTSALSSTEHGEGMDEETLARATEPFFTTKGVGKGTGLGLSMVHGLAAQSGGRLLLRSRKGTGTTAEIWLPVAEAEIGRGARAPPEAGAAGASAEAGCVLAVDDDALVLMNTATMLEDLGHTRGGGVVRREALDVLGRASKVDLVITDQAMPQMTGGPAGRPSRPTGRTCRSSWRPAMPSCPKAPTPTLPGSPSLSRRPT